MLKGWSAFAGEEIEAGQFVCQYAGELLGSAEAALRLKQYDEKADRPGHALLVLLHLCSPDKWFLTARKTCVLDAQAPG